MQTCPSRWCSIRPIEGEGEWLNTSIYTWRPSGWACCLRPTTGRPIPAGLEDTTGGVLAEDYTWSFTTQLPRVTEIYPQDGFRLPWADRGRSASPLTSRWIGTRSRSSFTLDDADGHARAGHV